MNGPRTRESQGQHSADGCGLHNGTENLSEVYTGALGEAAKDPSCLVALKRAISLEFVFENPFACHHIGMRRLWKEIPGVVGEEGGVLGLHCRVPVRVGESSPVGARDRR